MKKVYKILLAIFLAAGLLFFVLYPYFMLAMLKFDVDLTKISPLFEECEDCTFEEAMTCYKSKELHSDVYYKTTTRGVCVADYVCRYFEGCESIHEGKMHWTIVEDESKEDFRIEKVENTIWGNPAYIIHSSKGDFLWWSKENDGRIQKVDGASFKYLGDEYYKDKDHVYYGDEIIEEADKDSFAHIKEGWAKDKDYIYKQGVIINDPFELGYLPSCFYGDGVSNVIDLINDERIKNGAREVVYNEQLELAANKLADDMKSRNYFDRVTPDGRDIQSFVDETEYQYEKVGVNLAQNFSGAKAIVQRLMIDDKTRDNILDKDFEDFGAVILDTKEEDERSPHCLMAIFLGKKFDQERCAGMDDDCEKIESDSFLYQKMIDENKVQQEKFEKRGREESEIERIKSELVGLEEKKNKIDKQLLWCKRAGDYCGQIEK